MDWLSVGLVIALAGSGLGPGLICILAWRLLVHVRTEQDEVQDATAGLREDARRLSNHARLIGEASQRVGEELAAFRVALTPGSQDSCSGDASGADYNPGQRRAQPEQAANALADAADKARRQEARANALGAELESLRARASLAQEASRKGEAAQRDLQVRLDGAEAEQCRLKAELADAKSRLSRTLTEKEFIEERFLRLTRAHGDSS